MNASKYEYQSEFARRYFGQGKAAGKAEGRVEGRVEGHGEGRVVGRVEGRVEIILRLLATRYGILSAAVEARVRGAGSAELDSVAERVLTASSLEEALGLPGGSMCVPR